MKVIHKFFVIALLLLSIIFSLTAVAAVQEDITFEQSDTEEVSTETISASPEEDQVINSVEDASSVNAAGDQNEKLQASEDEKLAADETKTFEDVQKKINNATSGDTIYLDGQTYVFNRSSIHFERKNLTIVGGSELNDGKYAVLDAKGRSNIMSILHDEYYYDYFEDVDGVNYTVTLDSIIFTNSVRTALTAACNLNIKNCIFMNGARAISFSDVEEYQIDNYGGFYYTQYSKISYDLNVIDSSFINNTIKNSNGIVDISKSPKVSIYNMNDSKQYGKKTFRNCAFENNTAVYGGAIYIAYGANIQNCSFIRNTATQFGGAIYHGVGSYSTYSGTRYTVTNLINNSDFISNNAVEGGAIYGDFMNITGNTFTANSAGFFGGALNIKSFMTINISNNEFTNNYAPKYDSHSMYITSQRDLITVDLTENIVNSDISEIYFDKPVNGLYAYILDGKTTKFCEGNIKIRALVTDDEGNKISAREFTFIVGEEEYVTNIIDSIAEIEYNATLADTGKVVTQKLDGPRDRIYDGTLEIIPFAVVFDFDDFTGAMGTAVKIPIYVTDAAGHPLERTIKATYNAQRKELVSYNGVAHVLISLPLQKTSFNLAVECEGETKVRKVNVMDPHDDIAIVIDMAETENGYTGRTVTIPISVHDGKGNGLIGDLTVSIMVKLE